MATAEVTDIINFLQQCIPFEQLPEQAQTLAARNVHITYHRQGTKHFLERRLYLVRSGAVEVRNSDNLLTEKLCEGESFGHPDLIKHHAGNCVEFPEDSLLYQLEENTFEALCTLSKTFRRHYKVPQKSKIRLALANRSDSLSLTIPVKALMTRKAVSVECGTSVRLAAKKMNKEKVSSLLILKKTELKGILTDSDLRKRLIAKGLSFETTVDKCMTENPVFIAPENFIFEAILKMGQHNIHHLPVVSDSAVAGLITTTDIVRTQRSQPVFLIGQLWKASTVEEIVEICRGIPDIFIRLVEADARATDISQILTAISDAVTQKLLGLGEEKFGSSPIPFAWLAFGSQGREDQNISSDQDNALLLDDSFNPQQHQEYFTQLTTFVCDALHDCGYIHCPGDIMAKNPKWQLTVSQWQDKFRHWISTPEPLSVMHSSIFFDLRLIYGEQDFLNPIKKIIIEEAPKNKIFLAHLARNCLTHQPPLGFFRNFVVDRSGEHRNELDLKHYGSIPITDLARYYALSNGIEQINTLERLQTLAEKNSLNRKDARNLIDAHEFINSVRLKHQAQEIQQKKKPDNFIAPGKLSSLQRNHLKDGFHIIKRSQDVIKLTLAGNIG